MPSLIFKPESILLKTVELIPNKVVRQHNILFILWTNYIADHMYFHHFRHLGRHLEFLKLLNDDRLSSSRIFNCNVLITNKNPSRKKLYTQLPGPSKIRHIRHFQLNPILILEFDIGVRIIFLMDILKDNV